MFAKFVKTSFPPIQRPIMVWDGECGFCKYWITRWKSKTGDSVDYKTFQEIGKSFADIPLKEFKKASRLIETDGAVYSGPDSAYRSFTYFENQNSFFHKLYQKNNWFTSLSDHTYNFIAKHRPFFFKLTKILFGNDPTSIKPYWFLWLLIGGALIYLLAISAFITKF